MSPFYAFGVNGGVDVKVEKCSVHGARLAEIKDTTDVELAFNTVIEASSSAIDVDGVNKRLSIIGNHVTSSTEEKRGRGGSERGTFQVSTSRLAASTALYLVSR